VEPSRIGKLRRRRSNLLLGFRGGFGSRHGSEPPRLFFALGIQLQRLDAQCLLRSFFA
jgi:hypothetical protein